MEQFFFEKISESQNNHWWYKSRREIFLKILRRIKFEKPKILDYGSGAGANVTLLKKINDNIDIFEPNKLMHPRLKKIGGKVVEKVDQNYDLILLTDVIEHIENDKELLISLTENLSSNGYILITAPAYQFLYSSKDVQLKHYRRYNKRSLTSIIPKNLEIINISYLNFFLFLPLSLIILTFKILNKKFSNLSEEIPNKFINFILYKVFSFEKYFINNLNFPFGLTILALVKKKN